MRINNYVRNMMFQQSLISRNNSKRSNSSNNLAIKDTLDLSEESLKQLNNSTSYNREIDSSINIASYLEKADNENQKTIDNCGSELKAQVPYKDEFSAYEEILKDKYQKLVSIAKCHDNPEQYITDKYLNPNSSVYVTDLTDEERRVAFTNEIQMLNTGELASCDLRDSAFRGLSKKEGLLKRSEGDFHRDLVNNQFIKILKNSGIKGAFNFDINIDPYSYEVNVNNDNSSFTSDIKRILESGNNAAELFKHIIISSLDNGHNNKKITEDGKSKFNLYHQCLEGTDIDIRELEEKNGTYYTKDGKDIIDVYNDAVDKSVDNGTSYMPKNDAGNYKKWFSDLVHSVSSKGWNNMNDMILSIKVTNKGFIDLQ